MRSRSPGWSTTVTDTRPVSSKLSEVTVTPSGASMTWSMAAANRSPLILVTWTIATLVPSASCHSDRRGASRRAETRGSPDAPGSGSLATSSDCTTMRTAESTGATS